MTLMKWASKQKGFTIVELLIVIVVIGILAAITIVAYNGIQNKAKQSAVQSRLTQSNKKILTYAVTHSDTYPEQLEDADIDNSDHALEYSVDNTKSPPTYGLTATSGSFSYFVSSTNSTPKSGGYPGHAQNGVAVITNLVNNPNFDTNIASWAFSSGTGGAGGSSRPATGGVNGGYYRLTWTTLPTSGTAYITNGSGGTSARPIEITGGQPYVASGWVRSSWAGKAYLGLTPYDDTDTSVGGIVGSTVTLTPNTWTRINASMTPASTATTMVVRFYVPTAGFTGMVTGSTLDIDQVMLTQGTAVYDYADGNSTDWVWNGPVNGSTSKGPGSI